MTTDPAPPAEAERPAPLFDRHMLEALVCPLTQATLSYDAERHELISRAAGLAFPIRNGIPIMIAAEARALD
ncbi:MAG: Trm112 family protein [Rhodobacterales bacterium]|nr:Trm112 family protein [Rhodobacterales bacterium]